MKICVCVKHVPDTAASIKLNDDTGFEDSEIKFVVNPYDECGIEEAVRMVEKEGGEKQVIEMGMPCVIGVTKGLNEPRYPKFPDIMKAKKKKIDEIDISELKIDKAVSGLILEKLESVPERSGARMFEAVPLLTRKLKKINQYE